MGIYQGFRTVNTKNVLSYNDKNLVGDTFKILNTLQDRQNLAVAKRDEVAAALEETKAADQDKAAWELAKKDIDTKLATIPESAYIGDLDRQINKIARSAKNKIQEVEGNYERRQKYLEEGKKMGLDEKRLSQYVDLSNRQGGLQYDPLTGQFGNRFSGRAFVKPPTDETLQKAVSLLKPSVIEYVDANGQKVKKTVLDPLSADNQTILKTYMNYSPELQAEMQFQNDYKGLIAEKTDFTKQTPEMQDEIAKWMVENATMNYKEAILKHGVKENEQKILGMLTGNALLRFQNDISQELSEEGKLRLQHNMAMTLARLKEAGDNARAGARLKLDYKELEYKIAKEEREAKEADGGTGLLTDDVVRGKYENLTDKNGVLEERGYFSKLGESIASRFGNFVSGGNKSTADIINRAMNKKYDLGEAGHNIMIIKNIENMKIR